MTPEPFAAAVEVVLRRLSAGEVVTYGEVAAEAGYPGAARAVGHLLARSGDAGLPWWRVVTSTGRLVPDHEAEHARRLRAEGVEVDEGARRVRFGHAGAMPRKRPQTPQEKTTASRVVDRSPRATTGR